MPSVSSAQVKKIYVACEAGMGSSTMAVSILKKELKAQGMDITVKHTPVNRIPDDADLIIVHAGLASRAKNVQPSKVILKLQNFMDQSFYAGIVSSLAAGDVLSDEQ